MSLGRRQLGFGIAIALAACTAGPDDGSSSGMSQQPLHDSMAPEPTALSSGEAARCSWAEDAPSALERYERRQQVAREVVRERLAARAEESSPIPAMDTNLYEDATRALYGSIVEGAASARDAPQVEEEIRSLPPRRFVPTAGDREVDREVERELGLPMETAR